MPAPRVLLADDHPRVAEAIGAFVAEAFELIGTVGDGRALVEAANTLQPDVIVADISMPGTDGLTAMRQLREQLPGARVILLTNYADAMLARIALDAGASGFVVKVYAATELVPAIRAAVAGGTYVSSTVAVEWHGLVEAAAKEEPWACGLVGPSVACQSPPALPEMLPHKR